MNRRIRSLLVLHQNCSSWSIAESGVKHNAIIHECKKSLKIPRG